MTSSRLTLRPYQQTDVETINTVKPRVLVTNDAGTGKTVTASRALEVAGTAHNVILCKAHLVVQWIRHLEAEGYGTLGKEIGSVVGRSSRDPSRFVALGREAKVAMLSERGELAPSWYVLTYATVRRMPKALKEERGLRTVREVWSDQKADRSPRAAREPFQYPLPLCDGFVLDESSAAKGRKSQQYTGCYLLAVPTKTRRAARIVIELNADPIWREPDDLYAQLRLLDRVKFNSYWDFVDRYCKTEETDYGTKVVGAKQRVLARVLAPYMIKRRYGDPDVNIPVPDIIHTPLWTSLSAAGDKAYDACLRDLAQRRRAGYGVGSGIADLSRITAHDSEKIKDLKAVIGGIREQDARRPVAVFCWYQDTAALLGRTLGLPVFTGASGGTAYTRGDAIKGAATGFVATIGCIQEGVDLSHLRHMVFYEVDYTHGAMDQVRKRLARWRKDSSTDPVHAFYVLASGSVDEVAYDASTGRGVTANDVMDRLVTAAGKEI